MDPNPFAPPAVEHAPPRVLDDLHELPLASRGARLWATVLDGLVTFGVCLPAILLGSASKDEGFGGALGFLAVLMLWTYQWYLVSTTGQTLGKRWAGIRIVMTNGRPVSFVSAVLVRTWVFTLITSVPWIGGIIAFVDPLWIFGSKRRCLHDCLAGTMVVQA